MTDEQKRQKIEDLAAETLEFLDNHDDLSNIHKVDALTVVMGCLLARMRPNVMKSIMPEVLKSIQRYADEFSKQSDGAAHV